jgi:hypothetical protein
MNELATFGSESWPKIDGFAAHNPGSAVIRDKGNRNNRRFRRCRRWQSGRLRTVGAFRFSEASVWNHLKRRFFLLHPAAVLNIDGLRIIDGLAFL